MADLRKEEFFPADAFGLFYLQITRIPGGWHRHAEYEIFYHISGPIVFEVEGELYPLRPGDFLLLPPDVEHRVHGLPAPGALAYEGILLKLKPELMEYLKPRFDAGKALTDCFAKRKTGYLLRLPRNPRRISGEMLFRLLQVQKAPETYGHAINQLSVMSLFLVNLYNQDAELRKQEIENRSLTENVTEYINQHYADSLTIDQLAEQFFVGKYHLMHEFSQKTGTSVYRYLMQQRLHAVCELLEQGTVPNEAYLLCGFKDYANFYRAFRSAYGQSPREYARAHRKAAEEPASPDA